ncbi:hypothetical protein ACFWD7_48810 [Streptomyces mirabilis]|uniref:hypothetical protein n=1 Tax=Streptomyces mirabilis TaxID=68239 RepID=UPI00367D132B
MTAPRLTAAVTIACDARPGTYPLTLTSAGAARPAERVAPWVHVRVEPANEAARRACRNKVKMMPPPDREEHWAANTTWPQSEWDVRSFRCPVYRHAPDQGENHPNQPWARLRIAPASTTTTCPTQQAAHPSGTSRTEVVAWAAGGVLLAAAGTSLLLKCFRSRRADTPGTPPHSSN